MLQPLEEQFQAQMGARLNPRQLPPEGNIFPTVDQLPPSTTPSDPWVPMMPFYGAQPQGSFSMMPQSWQPEIAALPEQEWTPYSAIFRSLGGKKLQDGEVVPGRSKWDIAEAALDTTDFLPGGGPIGDVLGLAGKGIGKLASTVPWGDVAKAIPEGTISAGFLSGWFKPKDIKKSTRNKLEDIWKHPVWTNNKWAPNPDSSEIRRIGAEALYQDDVVNNIPGTTPQTYMQQGAGIGQTLEQKIASIGSGGDSPESLIKKSSRFNKMAADLRSGDDELMGNAEYWIDSRLDALEEYYDVDIFNANGQQIFRNNEGWAKEFDRISRDLTAESKSVEKWIADKANSIMDEEINIMERGMAEFTGKGLPQGGSGTLPPQGTKGILPSKKPLYKTDFVNPERVRTDHLTGWFDENIQVDIDDLKTLPGYKGEHTAMGSEYSQNLIENLSESMKKEGWSGDSVMIFVEKDGSVTIGEGNHRIQAALNAGLTEIPTEIKYFGNSNQNPNVWGRKYIDSYNPRKKPKLSRQDIISQGYYKRDDAGKVRYPDISQGYGDLVDINGQELASSLTPHEAAISIFDNLKQIPVEESWAGIPMQRQLRYIGDDNHTVIFSLSHDGKSLLVREGTHGGRANQLVRQGEIEEAGGALQWGRSDRGKEILKQRDEIAKAWIDHFLELPYVEKFRPEGTGGVLP